MISRAPYGPQLEMDSFDPGCILFLRSKEEIKVLPKEIEVGCYSHPCLVLEKNPSKSLPKQDMVRICTVRTFFPFRAGQC
jgi:hypothetical protein